MVINFLIFVNLVFTDLDRSRMLNSLMECFTSPGLWVRVHLQHACDPNTESRFNAEGQMLAEHTGQSVVAFHMHLCTAVVWNVTLYTPAGTTAQASAHTEHRHAGNIYSTQASTCREYLQYTGICREYLHTGNIYSTQGIPKYREYLHTGNICTGNI